MTEIYFLMAYYFGIRPEQVRKMYWADVQAMLAELMEHKKRKGGKAMLVDW